MLDAELNEIGLSPTKSNPNPMLKNIMNRKPKKDEEKKEDAKWDE